MGNDTSDFEEHFHKLYNFVSVVEDPYFKTVKVYRKNRYNFTHIMVVEQPLAEMDHSAHSSFRIGLSEKLSLIRRFQNRFTVQLQYFQMLEQRKYECGAPAVRMYIDYYNYTLLDYLTALRMKRQPLAIDELILVVQNLAEGMLTIRKMGIDNYRVTLNNIYLIIEDGIVLLNPIYFLYDNIYQIYNAKAVVSLAQEFQILPHQHRSNRNTVSLEVRQKQQLQSIAIEMTRYLSQQCLPESQSILKTLQSCGSIAEVAKLFVTSIQELNVQQFGQTSQDAAKLY